MECALQNGKIYSMKHAIETGIFWFNTIKSGELNSVRSGDDDCYYSMVQTIYNEKTELFASSVDCRHSLQSSGIDGSIQ